MLVKFLTTFTTYVGTSCGLVLCGASNATNLASTLKDISQSICAIETAGTIFTTCKLYVVKFLSAMRFLPLLAAFVMKVCMGIASMMVFSFSITFVPMVKLLTFLQCLPVVFVCVKCWYSKCLALGINPLFLDGFIWLFTIVGVYLLGFSEITIVGVWWGCLKALAIMLAPAVAFNIVYNVYTRWLNKWR